MYYVTKNELIDLKSELEDGAVDKNPLFAIKSADTHLRYATMIFEKYYNWCSLDPEPEPAEPDAKAAAAPKIVYFKQNGTILESRIKERRKAP